MLSFSDVLAKVKRPMDTTKDLDSDVRPVIVMMPNGALLYVRDVVVGPNRITGEVSVILDIGETV